MTDRRRGRRSAARSLTLAAALAGAGCGAGDRPGGVADHAATLRASPGRGGVLVIHAANPGSTPTVVTIAVGGRPLASAATPPFDVPVDAAAVRGRTVTLILTDDRGRERRSLRRVARVEPTSERVVEATPRRLGPALRALAAGGRVVHLAAGSYDLHDVRIGSGSVLSGDGPATRLRAPARSYGAVLRLHGSGIRVSDLAIDGGGAGPGAGRAVEVADGSAGIRLSRLSVTRARDSGIWLSGAHRDVVIEDSTIAADGDAHGGGVMDYGGTSSAGVLVTRTVVRGFRGWGIAFLHEGYGDPSAARGNVALANHVSDIVDPERADGTNEGGIWSGGAGARILRNVVHHTGWTGVETVGSSIGTVIAGNRIDGTPTGIYLEHSTHRSFVESNRIADVETGINVEWTYDGVGSADNVFAGNTIHGARRVGIFVDVADDRNRIEGNRFEALGGPAVILQGSSDNTVTGNVVCAGAEVAHEQDGLHDDGSLASPRRNEVAGNHAGC